MRELTFCLTCGWPINLSDRTFETVQEVLDRPSADVSDDYERDLVWRHAVEPSGHLPEPGGVANDRMQEILAKGGRV